MKLIPKKDFRRHGGKWNILEALLTQGNIRSTWKFGSNTELGRTKMKRDFPIGRGRNRKGLLKRQTWRPVWCQEERTGGQQRFERSLPWCWGYMASASISLSSKLILFNLQCLNSICDFHSFVLSSTLFSTNSICCLHKIFIFFSSYTILLQHGDYCRN